MINEIEDGGFAFPVPDTVHQNGQVQYGSNGMTLRQYAAIKLRVPKSGDHWLDEMITESLRNDFATMAMQAMIDQSVEIRKLTPDGILIVSAREGVPHMAYEYADSMLAAGSKA